VKRSPELAPLSRDHHQALEVALRLRRADESTVAEAEAHFSEFWHQAGQRHFEIEERLLLPAISRDDAEWADAAGRVEREHEQIRAAASELLQSPTPGATERAHSLGELLNGHVRFEERELFPMLEERLPAAELKSLGAAIERAEAG
jgi:hemerythrin-like domain-containing protein